MTDPNVGVYGMAEEYVEMDRDFLAGVFERDAAAATDMAPGGLGPLGGAWDYSYHELAPRLEREGWYQLAAGMTPIGKRVGDMGHMIVPKLREHKLGPGSLVGWYVIIESESSGGGLDPHQRTDVMGYYNYGEKIEQRRDIMPTNPNYKTRKPGTSGITYFYKEFPSLGAALDAVANKDYRGFTLLDYVQAPPDWYPQWTEYWMPRIPGDPGGGYY